MNIFISYGYKPFTTGIYFEKAFGEKHDVTYFGPSVGSRAGYSSNANVVDAIDNGTEEPGLFFFIDSDIDFFPRGMERLNCPTACYLVDVHIDLKKRERYAPFFDYIFVAQKDYVGHFKKLGYKEVHWLPFSCDPQIHSERPSIRIYDIGFVGSIRCSERRAEILATLGKKYKMNDYKKFYPKEEIGNIYSQSKIVVNTPVNGDLNMRAFEAMAAGALLMTEAAENGQRDLFRDGVNLIEYYGKDDLNKKVDYYLTHDDERARIAKEGQEEVMLKHTYEHRTDFVIDTIFDGSPLDLCAKCRKMTQREKTIAYSKVYSMLRMVDPIMEEIKIARNAKCLSPELWIELGVGLLKTLNASFPFTPSARKIKKYSASFDQAKNIT